MRYIASLMAALALFTIPALAQEAPKEPQKEPDKVCTRDYLRELDDDLQANKDMRRWTTDYLRPACRAIRRTEDISGKVFKMFGVDKLWDATAGKYISIDPQLTSQTCKYVRKLGEKLLTPEEDETKLQREIARCTAELKQ